MSLNTKNAELTSTNQLQVVGPSKSWTDIEAPQIYDVHGNELNVGDEVWTTQQCFIRDVGINSNNEPVLLLEVKYNWFEREPKTTLLSKKYDPSQEWPKELFKI